MKRLFVLVAAGALILAAAGCDTLNIGHGLGNTVPVFAAATFNPVTNDLTVQVTDPDVGDNVTVTVTVPAGLQVDATQRVISTSGTVAFHWSATVAADGGTGDTTVRATDESGAFATRTVTITVAPVVPGEAPVIGTVTYVEASGLLTVPVTDADSATVTVSVTAVAGLNVDNLTQAVTVPGSALFHWSAVDPVAGGTGSTTIGASDPEGHNATTVAQTITIAGGPANNVPVIGTVAFNGATGVLTVPVTDGDNEDVTVTVDAPAGTNVDHLTATVTGGNGDATFTYTATNAHAGATGTVNITADDGHPGGTDTATFDITIASVNPAAPVIGAVTYDAGTGLLTVPVTEADNDDVTVSVTAVTDTQVDHLTAVVAGGNGNATFTFSLVAPAPTATGDTNITADDAHGGTDTATQTITLGAVTQPPVIGAVTYVGGLLTVPVTDADNEDVTVTVTDVAGFSVDNNTQVVTGGNGNALFNWTPDDILADASGDTDITADDGHPGGTDTATQTISYTAPAFAADTLYPFAPATTAAAGSPVTVYVITGMPANPLQFLTTVGFTCETGGTYVADSFNYGVPGGARTFTDGYWALMGPPAPTVYLDLGDGLVPGAAVDIGGGLHRYNFAIVPQGVFAAPATLPNGAAVLFSFQVTFAAAGNYNFAFQLNDGAFDQTYYSDGASNNYYWGSLETDTITVN